MSPAQQAEALLDAFDVMSEAWAERVDLEAMIRAIPLNLPTAEFESRARFQIAAIVKQAFVEGMYQASGIAQQGDAN